MESGLKPGGTLILMIEAREGGGPAEYFDWSERISSRARWSSACASISPCAGYIFFLNCEQAQRYNILLLFMHRLRRTVAPMGMKAFSDVDVPAERSAA